MATVYNLSNGKAANAYYKNGEVAAVYARNNKLYLNSKLAVSIDSASSGVIPVPSWAVLAAYIVVGGGAGGSLYHKSHDSGYGNNGDFSEGVFTIPKGTPELSYKVGEGGYSGSTVSDKLGGVGGTTEVYLGSGTVAIAKGGTPTTDNESQGTNTGWYPLPGRSAEYLKFPSNLSYELIAGTSSTKDGSYGGGGYGSTILAGKGGDGRLRVVFWGGYI